jgi:DNA polymerase-3 subunit epsilon
LGSFDWAAAAYGEGAVFIAFDLETTGLESREDEIVELGAVKFDRRGIIARFSTLINPGIPMPPGAGRVNNISNEMLRDKPSLEEVFPDFLLFIQEAILIAHNAPFDSGFVNEKLKKRWVRPAQADGQGSLLDSCKLSGERKTPWSPPFPELPNKVIDTLVFAREVFPGRPSYKLQSLAADLGISGPDAHRAEDDALVCRGIFLACLGRVK